MKRWYLATLFVVLACPTFPRTVWTSAAAQGSSCRPSQTQNLLPDVVAPMTGASPAWLVDGLIDWGSADEPRKTLWVLRRTSESVRIMGRRIGAPGSLRLARSADMPADVLVIANPIRETVIPGGAPPEVMQSYVFVPSYVFYPSPGCWEFVIRIGQDETRITRELK